MGNFYNPSDYKNHNRPKPQRPKVPGPVKHAGMVISIPAGNRLPKASRNPKRPE